MARRSLLVCGIMSSLLYVAMNVVVAMRWEGYSSASQTVSELSAIGAPTRPLWVLLGIAYTLLVTAFGWGVSGSARGSHRLRVVGRLLVAYGLIGLAWPLAPMHLRGAELTVTDTMHIVFAIVTVLLTLLAIGFGAAAIWKAVSPLFHREHGDPHRVWRSDRIRWPPDRGKSAHAVGRDLGAHQHRHFPLVGRGAGHRAPAPSAVSRQDRRSRENHNSRRWTSRPRLRRGARRVRAQLR